MDHQSPSIRATAAAIVFLAAIGLSAQAQFPTPEQAGFHHCMLIYDAEKRDAAGFLPHVGHLNEAGEPDQWLFDAFLFCSQKQGPSTGESYMTGATNREDWAALLDEWFAPGVGWRALQEAADEAEEALGPISRPLHAIVTIPYPAPGLTDFGDVDGDGATEDLTQPDDYAKALEWYLDEVIRRFGEAALPDIELWGFYWTWEGVSKADARNVAHTSRLVHERGRRFLWIPWYQAPGWQRWREFGFDVALMQPNYAFYTYHRDTVRNDRLIETAAQAREHGLGVEMETGYSPDTNPRVREIFRDYMAFGAPEICGYQPSATVYFQSYKVFPNLLHAEDPDARHTYDQIAAYVRGERVPRSGHLRGATVTRNGVVVPELVDGRFVTAPGDTDGMVPVGDAETEFAVRLAEPRDMGGFEVSVLQQPEATWTGTVSVEAAAEDGTVLGLGWRRAMLPPARPDSFKTVLPVPLDATGVSTLKVRFLPIGEQPDLLVDEFSSTVAPSEGLMDHLALGRPYRVWPEMPRQYLDRGGRLTDSVVATAGWQQGNSVGWYGQKDVTIVLDLGEPAPVNRCVVHCDGGGVGAVYFPTQVSVALGTDVLSDAIEAVGRGAPPKPPAALLSATDADVVVDWQRESGQDEVAASGHIGLAPEGGPVAARYVALHFRHRGWLMVSEIEVYAGGRNVARGAEYYSVPLPAPATDAKYADDGRLLVDGHVANGLVAADVCGWSGAERAEVTIDLGSGDSPREVVVHALGGGKYGVFVPGRVTVQFSDDGTEFVDVASVEAQDPGGDSCRDVPISVSLAEGMQGRYLRVEFTTREGWLLLSEIEVR